MKGGWGLFVCTPIWRPKGTLESPSLGENPAHGNRESRVSARKQAFPECNIFESYSVRCATFTGACNKGVRPSIALRIRPAWAADET